jgi:hypothetical protein
MGWVLEGDRSITRLIGVAPGMACLALFWLDFLVLLTSGIPAAGAGTPSDCCRAMGALLAGCVALYGVVRVIVILIGQRIYHKNSASDVSLSQLS